MSPDADGRTAKIGRSPPPPAMISSYRHADQNEGEGWGWTDLTQTTWASSAAHLYGRDIDSSETVTMSST